MKRAALAICLVISVSSNVLALEPSDFVDLSSLTAAASTWENQSGSTMTIVVDNTGNVSGQYINRAAGTGCQNSPYPISGRVTGNFIAFSVAWNNPTENCNSATGWAGYAQVTNAGIEIVTNWNLAYQSPSTPMIEQGSDTFTHMPQVSSSALIKQ